MMMMMIIVIHVGYETFTVIRICYRQELAERFKCSHYRSRPNAVKYSAAAAVSHLVIFTKILYTAWERAACSEE